MTEFYALHYIAIDLPTLFINVVMPALLLLGLVTRFLRQSN